MRTINVDIDLSDVQDDVLNDADVQSILEQLDDRLDLRDGEAIKEWARKIAKVEAPEEFNHLSNLEDFNKAMDELIAAARNYLSDGYYDLFVKKALPNLTA